MTAILPRSLIELAEELDDAVIVGDGSIVVSSIADDSRNVIAGTLFIALDFDKASGKRFVADALGRGAVALVIDAGTAGDIPPGSTAVLVPDARRALARLAARTLGNPAAALRIVGITGTNGKTTTSFMLSALLGDAQHEVLRIGTLGAAWKEHEINNGYTTPPPLELQALFARALADGVDCVVMEVSSHALALQRVAEVPTEIGIFTNLTRDHLDFHASFEAYAAEKRKLFTFASFGIFNVEDACGRRFYEEFGGCSYAIDVPADLMARDVVLEAHRSMFTVEGIAFSLPIPGRFNILNALAAIAAAKQFGIKLAQMSESLRSFRGVPGRMERFHAAGCTVIVDYSHTPDALERVLLALRESAAVPVTLVFGCGGDRDAGKRSEMGAIAQRLADRVIVTSDNPRTEDPQAIADAVIAGMSGQVECVLDRHVAIERAILEAAEDAIVVIAGKGAEPEQIIGTRRFPFDDRREAERALARRAARGTEHTHPL